MDVLLGTLVIGSIAFTSAYNFPSLLTMNASLAIVIDREFVGEKYDTVKNWMQNYLEFAHRKIFTHGGVNVQYYSWTRINVKRGELSAVLSIASCEDTWELYNMALPENLLLMAISEPDCPRLPLDSAITVPMLEAGQEMPQMLLDLRTAKAYTWSSAVMLFDNTLDRDMITRALTALSHEAPNLEVGGAAISLMKLANGTSSEQREAILRTLANLPTKQIGTNFLVVVSVSLVATVMAAAKTLNMVNPTSQWLYVICDTNDKIDDDVAAVTKLIGEGDNVSFLYNNSISYSTCATGLKCHAEELLAGFCKTLDNAIASEREIASQVSDEEWEAIRPTKSDRKSFLLKGIKTHLAQFGSCDNCTMWRLRAGNTWGNSWGNNSMDKSTSELLQVGYWRPSDGPSFTDVLFPHVQHGFRRRTLPLVSFHNPPWQILKVNESGQVVEHGGIVFDVIKELAANLNFTYTVQIANASSSNGSYNVEFVTNTVPNVIIDMVRNKQVFLAACGVTVTSEREKMINFTTPISTQRYTFLVARPRELSRVLLFMSPFSSDVIIHATEFDQSTWLCLSFAVILMGPTLYFVDRFSPVYECRGISIKRGLSTVQNCMWYMYGALLQQGGMHLPDADSSRIIVGTWWMVVLVMVTTYCGNLVAFLTFPKIDIPITTLNELLQHRTTVTWGTMKGTYIEDYLRASEEPKYRAIYDGMMSHEGETTAMISAVQQAKHVLIDWKSKLQFIMKKYYLETGRCDFALGDEEFLDEQIAMIITQGNPYLQIINSEIKRLHQVGLIQKWLDDYLPKKDRCWKVGSITEVNNHTVNMDDMQGSFFVLFLGFMLALLWIIGEKLWHRRNVSKEDRIIRPFVT